jgi:hypothetical protein
MKYFIIRSYWRTTYLCKQPVRFLWVHSGDFDNRFLILSGLSFRVTLCIRRTMPHYYQWSSKPSILLSLSWVRIISILWLNWTNLNVQKSEKVDMWISRSVWWKSKLCFLGIICNATLFVVKIKHCIILSYWRATYLCKQPVRSLSIDSSRFGNSFLILRGLSFISTLSI